MNCWSIITVSYSLFVCFQFHWEGEKLATSLRCRQCSLQRRSTFTTSGSVTMCVTHLSWQVFRNDSERVFKALTTLRRNQNAVLHDTCFDIHRNNLHKQMQVSFITTCGTCLMTNTAIWHRELPKGLAVASWRRSDNMGWYNHHETVTCYITILCCVPHLQWLVHSV